jgi:hypothetical protein
MRLTRSRSLKTMSQHSNVKLRDVAVSLARDPQPTGEEEP